MIQLKHETVKVMKLYNLAKLILTIEKSGLSKVRFAKTIYFVHKELVRLGVMEREEIKYIRMPLGPVPDGFMSLADDYSDITTVQIPTGLSYNSVNYQLTKRPLFNLRGKNEPLYKTISDILGDLDSLSTSDLVETSHQEPSWIFHSNSEVYVISEEDMSNPRPHGSSQHISDDAENQLLQASLIKGMLDDIVSESTDLEYPSDGSK